MKAIIDEDGDFIIERARELKMQYCPFSVSGDACGDWCPAFREPEEQRGWKQDSAAGDANYPRYVLSLCNQVGDLFFDDIEDRRGKK